MRWTSTWQPKLYILGLAFFCAIGAGGARAQQGTPLPLPGVQDETAGAASPSAQGFFPRLAASVNKFKSMDEARDQIRNAYGMRDYAKVMSLAREIRLQYPDETFVGYFETLARTNMQARAGKKKQPFEGLSAIETPIVMLKATPTPTPIVKKNPVAAAAATPAKAPIAARMAVTGKNLAEAFQENQLLFISGGAIILVLVLGMGYLLLRRRAPPAAEPEPDESVDIFKELPSEAKAEAYARPSSLATVLGGRMKTGEAFKPPVQPEFKKPEEPVFPLDFVEEETKKRANEEELAKARAEAFEQIQPPVDEPILNGDEISFDEFDFDDSKEEKAPLASRPGSAVLPAHAEPASQGPHAVAEVIPEFPEDKIADSLIIELPAEAEKDLLQVHEAEYRGLQDFRFNLPNEGEDSHEEYVNTEEDLLRVDESPRHEETEEEDAQEIQIAEDGPDAATMTAMPEDDPAEATMDASVLEMSADTDVPQEEFQAFHPGETVTVHVAAEEDPEEADSRTAMSQPQEKEGKVEDAHALDNSTDVFEREYKQGVIDSGARNWVGAIHHLSIAAALRPGAMDVKERLREARRMRAKELEGRG